MEYENNAQWIRPLLRPGENVLWYGKPDKIRLFSKEDIFLIPFSIVWSGGAFFGAYSTIKSGSAPLFGKLIMIPFVLVGFYLLVGRFAILWLQQRNLQYALTSQRLIQKQGNSLKTLELHQLPAMRMELHTDGSGTITFGGGTSFAFEPLGYGNNYRQLRPLFELINIADANRVSSLIETAQAQLLRSGQNEQW